MSDNANPSGVFFNLFLRSFILLRELGYVVEPRGLKPFLRRPTVREGVCRFCNTHCLAPNGARKRKDLQFDLHALTCRLAQRHSLGAIRSGTRYAKWAGLSLADTQTGRYGRLYSRRRLCARRVVDARSLLRILLELQQLLRPLGQNPRLPYN